MLEPEEKRIPIKSFTGNEEGQNLVNCYFKQKPDGTYNFHDKDDKVKAQEITVGRAFRFELDEKPGVFWTLTLGSDADEILCGNWNDKDDPSLADGTYQAEAGGSGEEEPNSASACA